MLTRDRQKRKCYKTKKVSWAPKSEHFLTIFCCFWCFLRQMLTRNRPKKGMSQNQKGELSAQTRFFLFLETFTLTRKWDVPPPLFWWHSEHTYLGLTKLWGAQNFKKLCRFCTDKLTCSIFLMIFCTFWRFLSFFVIFWHFLAIFVVFGEFLNTFWVFPAFGATLSPSPSRVWRRMQGRLKMCSKTHQKQQKSPKSVKKSVSVCNTVHCNTDTF